MIDIIYDSGEKYDGEELELDLDNISNKKLKKLKKYV